MLQSKDCHALWVSSKALETSMPFPQEVDGGVVVRDELGNPSGEYLQVVIMHSRFLTYFGRCTPG